MKYEIIKGSEKDFDLSPDWATLKERNTSGDLFFSEGHFVGCKVQGITTEHDFTIDDGNNDFTHLTLIAERRPINKPVWSGEGVPCVGIECEFDWAGEGFNVGIVRYISKQTVIIECAQVENSYGIEDLTFRPIRSPEDVARDEAKAVIADILRSSGSYEIAAGLIYDAIAAHKIPCVTKTPTVSELIRVTENATREDCEAIVKMLSGK